MTRIITTGCSFTHESDSWANYLGGGVEPYPDGQYDLVNVAEGGAGNEMNIQNAILDIHKNNYTHCIVQISGICRFELVVDERIESANDWFIPKENCTWIKSTGDQEWWLREKYQTETQAKLVNNALTNYTKHCYSEYQQIIRTLRAIVNCQTLCKHKQIKQLYFCWKDEFSQYFNTIKKSEELTAWWDQIDWSLFWFHNNQGGLSEWGIDHNFTGKLDEDHVNNPPKGWLMIDNKKTMIGHPSTECHLAFAEQVIKPWVNNIK